ncbi:MAG: rhomboid family intramembrane serine protease [Nanoarchaeota archaeon]|nr:rhomboid family intramembrane serine protease [Nanoarchaeota archaeon]
MPEIRQEFPSMRILRFPATFWLIAINVLFFLIAIVISLFYPNFIDVVALKPSDVMHGKNLWTILTSMFMHAGVFHLFANMISLMFLGSFLEKIVGKKRFLWIYFISGIMGSVFYILFSNPNIPAVGASGAIFGIAGMLAVLTPKMPVYIMFIPIAMPMWFGVILIMGVLWLLTISAGLPIGNTAHFGGLIVGLGYAAYLRHKHPHKTQMISNHFSR